MKGSDIFWLTLSILFLVLFLFFAVVDAIDGNISATVFDVVLVAVWDYNRRIILRKYRDVQ